ncbi:MAG TPA: gliding motility protein, partial [Myxococcaceae bacterium]|nr:gliding motility protein [Myxococcaceae bacterium]
MDRFGALDLYMEILAADPRHAGALGRLEAVVQREPQNALAADALLRAYREAGDHAKRAQLLENRVAVSTDPGERKTLLLDLADLRVLRGEQEMTYLALYRAFKEDPNDPALRSRLEAAAEGAGTHDELAEAYEEALPRMAEASDTAQVCLTLGRLYDQRLKEPERAIAAYEKARSSDLAAAAQALPALDRIYGDLDKPRELADVLEAQAALAEGEEKTGLLFRLGQIAQDRLEDPNRAAAAYEEILALNPGHLAAARLLEPIYAAAGRHDKLYEVLKLQRELTSGAERERVLGRMAQVSAEGLSDVGHSIEIYRELLQKNPRNEQAFTALDTLLEKGGRHDELLELLTQRLAATLEPRELVRLNDRVGRVLFRSLGRPDDALPYFKAALERDPRHRGALEELRAILEAAERSEELVAVLRRLLPLQENAEGVRSVRVRLAEILAALGRREEALDAARRALEVEPVTPEELGRVYAVFLQLKAFGDAVKSLELRAAGELQAENREAATATWFEVAELWSGPAQKPESAGAALERVLELD